jgi:hypothetical protein
MAEVLPGKINFCSPHVSWLPREGTIIQLTTKYLKWEILKNMLCPF